MNSPRPRPSRGLSLPVRPSRGSVGDPCPGRGSETAPTCPSRGSPGAFLLALTVGPFFAYLVWALTSHRWGHTTLAASLNLALWGLSPVFVAHSLRSAL